MSTIKSLQIENGVTTVELPIAFLEGIDTKSYRKMCLRHGALSIRCRKID